MMNVNDRMIKKKSSCSALYSVGQVHGRVEQHPDQGAEHSSLQKAPGRLYSSPRITTVLPYERRGEVSH